MNNLTRHQDDGSDRKDGQSQQLSEDMRDLFHLPVPAMSFDSVAVAARREPSVMRRRWRPALVAGAAAAGLALFLVGPSLLGGSPQNVSAQEVLARTQGVAATNSPLENTQSYHMVATSEVFPPPGAAAGFKAATENSIVETWYQDPKHQRSETYDADGRLVFGSVQNGDDLWFYSATDDLSTDDDGTLRVVRTTNGAMGFSTLGRPGLRGDEPEQPARFLLQHLCDSGQGGRGDGRGPSDLRDRDQADAGDVRPEACNYPGRRQDDGADGGPKEAAPRA